MELFRQQPSNLGKLSFVFEQGRLKQLDRIGFFVAFHAHSHFLVLTSHLKISPFVL